MSRPWAAWASSLRATWAYLRANRYRMAAAIGAVGVLLAAVVALLWPSSARHVALPPTPPRPVAVSIGPGTSAPSATKGPPKSFHCSNPVHYRTGSTAPSQICIPALKVDASVMQLGLNADRTVQVPPLSQVRDAGWYKYSAVPGAIGPTVILGHVDSAQYGEGVFFKLGRLHSGDTVRMLRADGKTATFRIKRVSEVSKNRFPTQAVYGRTSSSALRLITCGGKFDSSTGSYVDNIIAYGTLVSVRAT